MILSIGENKDFSFNNILESQTKYLFRFEYDLCYDAFEDDAVINAGQANDETAFVEAFNAYEEKNGIPDKIVRVLDMVGPGGGWPNVIIQTTKPMTVKEYADYLDEVYAYGGSAGPSGSAVDVLRDEGINVVKICN